MATDGDLSTPVQGPDYVKRKLIRQTIDFPGAVVIIELSRVTADELTTQAMANVTLTGADVVSLANAICGVAGGGPNVYRQRLRDWLMANKADQIG